jgi:CubicO group peptidase (beta-lactamase class C family)
MNIKQKLDREAQQQMKIHKVPGFSVVLIENGEIASHEVYGVKNSKTSDSVKDRTVFEVASLSKPVFAYGLLKLVEKGQLNLDTPLPDYLDSTDVKNDPRLNIITAEMVLSHTTGFPNWRPKNEDLKIYFKPGKRFNYSREGFVYLQKVVEHISGMPIEEYMKKTVFDPLDMTHSSYVWQKDYETLKAAGHDADGIPLLMYKPTSANMAFTLHATSLDYAKFVIAIMRNVGLKPETMHQMLTPQIRVGAGGPSSIEEYSKDLSPTVSWALGWGIQETTEGPTFWHWGDNGGFKSYVAGSQNGKGIIIFTNSENGLHLIPEIILKTTGVTHPALKWVNCK